MRRLNREWAEIRLKECVGQPAAEALMQWRMDADGREGIAGCKKMATFVAVRKHVENDRETHEERSGNARMRMNIYKERGTR
ncbi:MAG: hypothetical protein IJV27_03215 [Prevotella sp.]|nr:hypothetical protein [Prevotella sp.]